MFSREEVNHIQKVAEPIGDAPSKHLMEYLVDRADAQDCTVDELCVIIDVCAREGKLSGKKDDWRRLFSLGVGFQDEPDSGSQVSEALQQEFKKNKAELSNKATISREAEGLWFGFFPSFV